jgi:hypothetical protein
MQNFGRVGEFVLHDKPTALGSKIYRIEPLRYSSGNIDLVSSGDGPSICGDLGWSVYLK